MKRACMSCWNSYHIHSGDKNAVLQALDETIPSCDESRSDAYSLAVRPAASGYSINTRYQEYVGGQEFYEF